MFITIYLNGVHYTCWYHATIVDGLWEQFVLQVSHDDGATWDTARTWNLNVGFVTLEFKQASVILQTESYAPNSAFTDATKFHLSVGPGAGNSDRLYVDELEIAGLLGEKLWLPRNLFLSQSQVSVKSKTA
jgi:hypothetical protein